MKRVAVVSLALVASFLVSTFPMNSFSIASHNSPGIFGALSPVDPVDWWPMLHHDLTHTGYSTSTGPNTNQTLWNYATSGYVDSCPAVAGGVIFAGSGDRRIYALNVSTGVLVWNYTTGGYVYSSPAVAGGIVYVGSLDGRIYALNVSTGVLVWNYTTGGYVYSSPAVAGGIVYVGSTDGKVYALNAATGAYIWSYVTGNWVVSSPAVAGGIVYVGSTDGKVYALNSATGAYIWSYVTGGSVYYSSPAVADGKVYIGSYDHRVYALNVSTGVLVWNYTAGSYVDSSPAVAGGIVYVGSNDGQVYALNGTTGTYEWNYTTRGGVTSSPAVAGGIVYVGSLDGRLYALNVSTGVLVWSYTTGGSVVSSPAVADGIVFVGSESNKVYAFGQRLSASISPSSAVMDVGQSQLFTSSVTGDTSPYTYQWYLNGTPVPSATNPTWVFTASLVGSYRVYLNVTDAVSTAATSGTVPVNVNGQLSVGVMPASATLDVGQSQLFASNVSKGTLPYSYRWYLNGAQVSGAASSNWTFTPTSPDSYTVYLNVSDAVGAVVVSGVVTVTVNGPLSISNAPGLVTMDLGQSQLFTSTVSGGTLPFMYQWYANDAAVSGATSAAWAFTPSSIGSYNVYVNVTDNVGFRAKSNTASVVVNPVFSVSVSPSAVVLGVNESQLFASSVSGGTSPFIYQWFLNGTAVSGATSATWTFAPASAGSYTVYVELNDSAGAQAASNTATVNWPLSVSILPASATLDVGQSQLFTSNVSGGATPYSYQWYLNDTPVSGATNAAWTFTPTSVGFYTVYLNVSDAVGAVVTSGVVTVTVNGPLSISNAPGLVTMDLGQSQLFTSTVSGGTSPFVYQWYANGVAVLGATGFAWNFASSTSGSYNIYVNVTDSVGFTAKSNIATVTVNPALTVSISPTSTVMNVGQSQLLTSNVSGGTSPHSYQWYLNGAQVSGAASSNWTFTPTSPGSYTIYAKVNDTVGAQATSNTAHVQAGIHDVAVTNVTSSKTVVGQGYGGNITVAVQNQGNFTEIFNVTVYANSTTAASQNVTLSSGNSTNIILAWNTTGFAYGNYTIGGYAWPVPGETNTANNNGTDGLTLVTIPGDLNGDLTVGLKDLVILANAYGSRPGNPNWNPNADIDGNGIVGLTDLVIMAKHYGQHNP